MKHSTQSRLKRELYTIKIYIALTWNTLYFPSFFNLRKIVRILKTISFNCTCVLYDIFTNKYFLLYISWKNEKTKKKNIFHTCGGVIECMLCGCRAFKKNSRAGRYNIICDEIFLLLLFYFFCIFTETWKTNG